MRLTSSVIVVHFRANASLGSALSCNLEHGGTDRMASIEVGGGSELWLSELMLVRTFETGVASKSATYRAETSVSAACLRLWLAGPSGSIDRMLLGKGRLLG